MAPVNRPWRAWQFRCGPQRAREDSRWSHPRLAKYRPVSATFVSLPWALFLPLEEVNVMMAIVAAFFVEFAAAPIAIYNYYFWVLSWFHIYMCGWKLYCNSVLVSQLRQRFHFFPLCSGWCRTYNYGFFFLKKLWFLVVFNIFFCVVFVLCLDVGLIFCSSLCVFMLAWFFASSFHLRFLSWC